MKSKLNFKVIKENQEYDMHAMSVWVSSFHIYSPDATRTKIVVPGMPGSHLRDTQIGERLVHITMQIEADNMNDFDELKHRIFDLFHSKEEITIVRDLTPDKEIKVLQEGSYDINNITTEDGDFELFLTMVDPFIYGKEVTKPLTTETGTIINVEGTAETKPIFEFEVSDNITYAMVQNHLNEYMMIGQSIDVESQVPFQKYERIFYDDATSRIGWSDGSSGDIDGGVAIGNIISRNNRFVAESYGTGTAWHGPVIKKGLEEPLKDFRMKAFIAFWNSTARQVGRLEIYLLDVLGRVVCKVALKDTSNGRANTQAEFRAGGLADGKYIISEHGDRPGAWNNFSGQVHIEREGNKWYCYIAKVDTATGRHHTRRTVKWEDKENKYTNSVAHVAIHIGGVGTHAVLGANSGLSSIFIDKINQEPDGVPYIAGPGDKIVFDFQKRELLVNGENRKDLKSDLGGSYFTYKPGENIIALSPSAITGISKHRPACK